MTAEIAIDVYALGLDVQRRDTSPTSPLSPNVSVTSPTVSPMKTIGKVEKLEALSGAGISVFSSGRGHSMYGVTHERGVVFSFGENEAGQLGTGLTAQEDEPARVLIRTTNVIKKSDVISEEGVEEVSVDSMEQEVEPEEPVEIGTLCCSDMHSVIVLENGVCMACGDSTHGQCGYGGNRAIYEPKRVLVDQPMIDVACGKEHSIFLSRYGDVFACGSGEFGQNGRKDCADLFTPKHIVALREPIRFIACGSFFSVALTMQGEVLVWGDGSCGIMGNGTLKKQHLPTKVDALVKRGEKIVQVSCGFGHIACLSERGAVFTWGLDTDGQLGTGTRCNGRYPQEVVLDAKVIEVQCGSLFTAVLTEDRRVFAWGRIPGYDKVYLSPLELKGFSEIDGGILRIVCGWKTIFAFASPIVEIDEDVADDV